MTYLTRSEVLEKLKVSRTTLYVWSKEKGFPRPVRFGGNTKDFFIEEQVNNWIEKNTEAA